MKPDAHNPQAIDAPASFNPYAVFASRVVAIHVGPGIVRTFSCTMISR